MGNRRQGTIHNISAELDRKRAGESVRIKQKEAAAWKAQAAYQAAEVREFNHHLKRLMRSVFRAALPTRKDTFEAVVHNHMVEIVNMMREGRDEEAMMALAQALVAKVERGITDHDDVP